MAQHKHMKESEKKSPKKLIIFLTLIILIFSVFMFIDEIIKDKKVNKVTNKDLNISELTSVENETLVLKSTEENEKTRKIVYIYKENKLNEFHIIETYLDEDKYMFNKEDYKIRKDIEIVSTDDVKKEIHVQKIEFGSDTDLSYQELKAKYMKIIGAYEII